jgi:hypothetical protein
MRRGLAALVLLSLAATVVFAASGKRAPPAGSFKGAPEQFAHFSVDELMRGFLSLAFGSDLRIGARPRGIRRFDRPIKVRIVAAGSVDRSAAMAAIIGEYAGGVPALRLSISDSATPGDIEIRLIDEKNFKAELTAAFGTKIANDFVTRTDPQCMTSVKSDAGGEIVRAVSFIIVDQGDDVFLDCAYHELLHAFGLSNHDQRNPWTTLNQNRMVGYLAIYDRLLLTLLYDPRIVPGMTRGQVREVLPGVIADLGLAEPGNSQ